MTKRLKMHSHGIQPVCSKSFLKKWHISNTMVWDLAWVPELEVARGSVLAVLTARVAAVSMALCIPAPPQGGDEDDESLLEGGGES